MRICAKYKTAPADKTLELYVVVEDGNSREIILNTNVVKGGFEKNRLTQQSGGSFVVIDTAQGGERGGTLAEEAQTVYRRSFPCWYKQMPEAASSGGLGAAATNKHAPGIYRRIACRY